MKPIGILLFSLLSLSFFCQGQTPVSHAHKLWKLNETFSDEFNTGQLDTDKWNHDPNDWGTWSWEPENAYVVDTALTLRMIQKTHTRSGKEYYFTSGIVRNEQTFIYGYFEARIKASEKGQGTCPAFWLYSRGQPTPTEEEGVKYCEIDAVEIFQVPYDYQRLEMNLHTRIIRNGQLTWIRPGQGYKELTHNTWVAPWDPRDDYHTYGVWSRLDSIFWYVDGVQRGAKKNIYWHLPMHLTVSMGLRTPYERYINGVRTVMPYPDSAPEEGFPTEMFCDYVRVWNTDPQLYADPEKYHNAAFSTNQKLDFEVRFFAGNGESVMADGENGVTCKLQEIDDAGMVVQEFEATDASTVGKESGLAKFQFSLDDLVPSSSLPAGHQYVLKPSFRTSMDESEEVFLKEGYFPIQLTAATSINSQEAVEKINIINSRDGIYIQMNQGIREARITVYDLNGRAVLIQKADSENVLINKGVFQNTGLYLVSVKSDRLHRVEKVVINVN